MKILGVNAYHGDSSAALLEGGQLVAAVEEERFNRIKHWAGVPMDAIRWCLKGARPDHVAISRDPRTHFGAKVRYALMRPGQWRRLLSRAQNSIRVSSIGELLQAHGVDAGTVHLVEHHRAHLASAFFASPFEEAAVVSVDGFGDFSSVMWGIGHANRIEVQDSVLFPHSIGIFYTAFTQYLGFPKYGDEYKLMGLAAYGEPTFAADVRKVIRSEHGQIVLNLDYFTHHDHGVEMSWSRGEPVLGPVFSSKMARVFGPARTRGSELLQQHRDLAASVQLVLEECYFGLLRHVHRRTQKKALCLAGGVALNCAANGKIFAETPFTELYVQPAANDAGTSIGAALHVWHEVLGNPRSFEMRHAYWGPELDDASIRDAIQMRELVNHELSEDQLVDRVAREIAGGNVVGWFQGRMEFGPRALGARSILADPRRAEMRDILNVRIKHREPFRPFCPSILAEAAGEFFESDYPAPFMVSAYKIRRAQRDRIPAVTHADGTGRLQTVEREASPLYWKLIHRFGELTGVPILLNTSFNENEPIVNQPAEAIDCFLRTRMDGLAIGSHLLLKSENEFASTETQTAACTT